MLDSFVSCLATKGGSLLVYRVTASQVTFRYFDAFLLLVLVYSIQGMILIEHLCGRYSFTFDSVVVLPSFFDKLVVPTSVSSCAAGENC